VKSTIELAHNLGLKAIAEGVQDKYTLDRLTALGCDVAQGDYICAPLGGSALLDWLRHRAATVYRALNLIIDDR